jgi:hypothetical protein
MKEILDAPTPYGMIKEVESLIQTVDEVNTALVTKRRAHVLKRIDVHIARIEKELDRVYAASDLRNQCLYPLQKLKHQVEKQDSIAHINQALDDARDALDEAFEKIEAASKAKPKPKPVGPVTPPGPTPPKGGGGGGGGEYDNKGTGEPTPPVYVKKRTIVEAARLASGDFLETQEDIDAYLSKLRKALEEAVAAGERIEIR